MLKRIKIVTNTAGIGMSWPLQRHPAGLFFNSLKNDKTSPQTIRQQQCAPECSTGGAVAKRVIPLNRAGIRWMMDQSNIGEWRSCR